MVYAYVTLSIRDLLYDSENYFIVIGWEQANLSLILNLYCSGN